MASLRATDLSTEKGLTSYMVTLTHSGGFTSDQCDAIIAYHETDFFKNIVLVSELHQSGETHFHGVMDVKAKQASTLTKRYQRFYAANDLQWNVKVSVKVKTVTDKLGALYYCMKELTDEDEPLVLKGWKRTWLQEQFRAGIKHVPYKQLLKDCYFVNKRNGCEIVILFAERHNMVIFNKESYGEVVAAMAKDKYRFAASSHRHIYTELRAMTGDRHAIMSLVSGDLFNIED